MIVNRVFDRIVEIFLFFHQNFEHNSNDNDQHSFQNI
jgi:hypothetical protein